MWEHFRRGKYLNQTGRYFSAFQSQSEGMANNVHLLMEQIKFLILDQVLFSAHWPHSHW